MRTEPPTAPERVVFRCQRVLGAPVVSVRVFLRGGMRREPTPGLALVTGRSLTEGSRERDWRRVADEAEARGVAISGFASLDGHGLAVDALAREWRKAVEWAAELSLEPAFPADRAAWVARQAAGELESLLDTPEARAGFAFLDHLYRPHPRSRPLQGELRGSPDEIADSCGRFHRASMARGVVVVVAGEVDPDEVEAEVHRRFRAAPERTGAPDEEVEPRGRPERRRELVCGGEGQAQVLLGHRTLELGHRDHPLLELLGVILGAGAGLDGRLPQRIRERDGLAYGVQVGTVVGASTDPGHLGVWVATADETVERVIDGAVEELRRVVEHGVLETELAAARAWLLGREPFGRETARQWAPRLVLAELLGLPLDRPEWRTRGWREATREAVDDAARRWIRPDELKITVGRPAAS